MPGITLKSITIKDKQRSREIFRGQPLPHRSIVYIMDICDTGRLVPSVDAFKRLWEKGPNSAPNNIQNMYETCSNGRVLWNQSDNVVLGPVKVPCNGSYTRGRLNFTWDFRKSCGSSEQSAWMSAAEEYGRDVATRDINVARLMSITTGRRVVLILPPSSKCGWAGLAAVGCSSKTCNAYIKSPTLDVLFHELQHNNQLSHASRGVDEYGDSSDTMGQTDARNGGVCHNAANLWRIGWADPITTLTSTDLANRPTITYTLPAIGTTTRNFVRLNAGWETVETGVEGIVYYNTRSIQPTLYFSYRVKNNTRGGFDNGLDRGFHQKVFVHAYNGTQSDRDYNQTKLITVLSKNGSYAIPNTKTKLTVVDVQSLYAVVSLA